MTFLEKQIRPSIKVVALDTNDNFEVFAQLPKTMVKVINIKDMGVKDGKFIKRVMFTKYSDITYDELVNGLIRDKYSESEEFAILRKAINGNTAEYEQYNAYAEQCKAVAREWIKNRDIFLL